MTRPAHHNTDKTRLTAEEIADRVRENLVAFGGRQGFLADPGGWLDHVLSDQGEADEEDHERARQAIDMIVADHESAPVPETAEEMIKELRDEWGIVDAFVMDPGPGTVHIPTPDGSVFLSDGEGSHPDPERPCGLTIGRCFNDGREEILLWEDREARSISGALGQLAEEANKIPGDADAVDPADFFGAHTDAVLTAQHNAQPALTDPRPEEEADDPMDRMDAIVYLINQSPKEALGKTLQALLTLDVDREELEEVMDPDEVAKLLES